jgi:predicted transcriptional regulator
MKQQNFRSVRKTTTSRKATTFRLDPSVQQGLVVISKVLKVPLNRLVNEAVQAFVHKRTTEVAMSMEKTLQLLKATRAKDPEFERAMAEFVDSEARYAKEDPAEGEVKQKRGRMQTRVHELLNG